MAARIPTEEILEELRRVARVCDRPPSANDFSKWANMSRNVVSRRFDSWMQARTEAGLVSEIDRAERRSNSAEELIEDLRHLGEQLGKSPSASDMNQYGEYSPSTYQRRFGSWEDARKRAGFEEAHTRVGADPDELLTTLEELADELGRTPTQEECDKYGEYSHRTYINYFGSWNKALEKIGHKPHCGPGLGAYVDCDQCASETWVRRYRMDELDHHFCEAECFYEHRRKNALTGSDHPAWTGYTDEYGSEWVETRSRVLKRDDQECQQCGLGGENHKQEYGCGLHVHHITPLREFDNLDEAHDLDNLVALCVSCHGRADS